MNHDEVSFLILGAGPTGLGAAYRLQELGVKDYLVIEASHQVGGLAGSFLDSKGFTWDIGGHVQFSHYSYFDDLMLKALGPNAWLHHQRESWVWMRERFVPYPFQNNIRFLPKEEMWECLSGLIDLYKRPTSCSPQHFGEWMQQTFGSGITRHFMEPYNFKVWAYPGEKMSYQWIGERVAITDLERVTKNILFETDDLSWGPNSTFQFPRRGGTGAIWESVADLCGREKILLHEKIIAIDPSRRQVTTVSGQTIGYRALLSTIPLDHLAGIVRGLPAGIRDEMAALRYSSSNIVGIGLKGSAPEELRTKCWMYFPEGNCPFYRVTVFSNYSPNNVPSQGAHWSLMAEVSESLYKRVEQSTLIKDVVQGMRNTHLLDERSEIVSTWKYRAEHGYPTPFLGRDQLLEKIQTALQELGIFSRGRFGGWKYEVSNQDHSFMQGVEWTNRMLLNVPEVTYFFPTVANANWAKSVTLKKPRYQ